MALALAVPGTALAQLTDDMAVDAARAFRPDQPVPLIQARAAVGAIGEDAFFTFHPIMHLVQKNWGIAIQAPVRIRLIDRDPKDDDHLGFIRKEDWDEPTDFLKFLRYAYVGDPNGRGPFYFRVGELVRSTIGHGTIVNRYSNGMDLDRWRLGVEGSIRTDWFRAEAMIGDVLSPDLTAMRLAFSPVVGLWLGTSWASDWHAPFEIAAAPRDATDPYARTNLGLDDRGLPAVASRRHFSMLGADAGLELPIDDVFTLTPYVDFNKMVGVSDGWGLHTGGLMSVRFDNEAKKPVIVYARAEYRRVAGNYLGPYFDASYQIERFRRLSDDPGPGQTKLGYVCVDLLCSGGLPARNGVFFELQTYVPDLFKVGGSYSAYSGDRADGTFRLSVEVPGFHYFEVRAFYYRVNMASIKDAFGADDRTAVVAELRVPFLDWFSANAKWWRVWSADRDGRFRAVDDWSIGLGLKLRLGGKDIIVDGEQESSGASPGS